MASRAGGVRPYILRAKDIPARVGNKHLFVSSEIIGENLLSAGSRIDRVGGPLADDRFEHAPQGVSIAGLRLPESKVKHAEPACDS